MVKLNTKRPPIGTLKDTQFDLWERWRKSIEGRDKMSGKRLRSEIVPCKDKEEAAETALRDRLEKAREELRAKHSD